MTREFNPNKCETCEKPLEIEYTNGMPNWCSECFQGALEKAAEISRSIDGHTQQIGRFTVAAKEWKKGNQHRIYFSLDTSARACYDMNEEVFIKCRGRVGARMEHAIREAFGLE